MKIGIITHYYKSQNYGGNLQAYALCEKLNQMGYNAEQISYDISKDIPSKYRSKSAMGLVKKVLKYPYAYFKRKKIYKNDSAISDFLKERNEKMNEFNNSVIPHSVNVYDRTTIANSNREYDCFIVGSDQVWHPAAINTAYLLEFVAENKTKMSYAASLAVSSLNEQQAKIMEQSLESFKAVSVRENSAVSVLQPLSKTEVQVSVDPVLLLSKNEWEKLLVDIENLPQKYLFCYFLGVNEEARSLARQYAQENGLKIVTFPYLQNHYRKCDDGFGDIKIYNAGPKEFISLINSASCVFTDSFHALVFSNIFQKQYFVFNRANSGAMSSRIKDITELFKSTNRFCFNAERNTLKYIDSCVEIDYSNRNAELEKSVQQSAEYLKRNLN